MAPGETLPSGRATRGDWHDFLLGVRFLVAGLRLYTSSPRLLVLGALPAVLAALLVLTLLAVLAYHVDDLSAVVTWFADDWSAAARTLARIVAGVAIVGAALMLVVLAFVALTLLIGDPFYESISLRVEQRVGGVLPEADRPWYAGLRASLVDSGRLLGYSALLGVPLAVAGLLPVLGQTVVPVLNVVFGGWVIALELIGYPCERRALRLADRRKLLRANRPLALGFGMSAFLLILIPFVGIFVMPAAVAGGTLLARHLLGLPTRPADAALVSRSAARAAD